MKLLRKQFFLKKYVLNIVFYIFHILFIDKPVDELLNLKEYGMVMVDDHLSL